MQLYAPNGTFGGSLFVFYSSFVRSFSQSLVSLLRDLQSKTLTLLIHFRTRLGKKWKQTKEGRK